MAERLTQVELLAGDHCSKVQWVFDAIISRQMSQEGVLRCLNTLLEEAGIEKISRSGFNRYALRVRSGAARRPVDLSISNGTSQRVFTDDFRIALAKAVGGGATLATEAILLSMILGNQN